MLHHVVPDEVVPGSLAANLDFYEPRTALGSSLSPGIHAALFARVDQFEKALEWLRFASRLDLDDLTGSTREGLHLATMGSVWQALAFGFAGLRPRGQTLEIDPHIPHELGTLQIRARFRGSRVAVTLTPESVEVAADPPISVRLAGRPESTTASPSGVSLSGRGHDSLDSG